MSNCKVTAVLVEHALQHATREEELARLRTKEPRIYGVLPPNLATGKHAGCFKGGRDQGYIMIVMFLSGDDLWDT